MDENDSIPVEPISGDVTVLQVDQSETVDTVKMERSDSSVSSIADSCSNGAIRDQSHRDRTLTEESWDVVKDDEVGFKGIPPLAKVPDRIQSNIPSALPSPSSWLQSIFDTSTSSKMKTSASLDQSSFGKEGTPPYSPLVDGGPTPPLRRTASDDLNNSVCLVTADDAGTDQKRCLIIPAKCPLEVERDNLVAICRLVVKDVIDESLKHPGGIMLSLDESDGDAGLTQLFVILERLLCHGLRVQKRSGILGSQTTVGTKGKELWQVLELIERVIADAKEITTSVREMPFLKTPMGRCRAWLRLALMQKKLSDYWNVLVDGALLQTQPKLRGVQGRYEPEALLRNEEDAIVVGGLLVGLNTIDCNLCLKPERNKNSDSTECILDSPDVGVLDYARYLSFAGSTDGQRGRLEESVAAEVGATENHVKLLSDQKNYLEELNRHFEAKLKDSQSNNESMKRQVQDAQDTLLKNKEQMLLLQEENLRLTRENSLFADEVEQKVQELNRDHYVERETYATSRAGIDSMLISSQKRMEDEIENHRATIRELNLQINLRKEIETAMKLMERDLHEKQDTLIVLRQQLTDVKAINLQLFKKSQDSEETLKHKNDLVPRFEQKFEQMNLTIADIESRLKTSEEARHNLESDSADLKAQLFTANEKVRSLETDLRIEREWRSQATSSLQAERQRTNDLIREMEALKLERDDLKVKEKELDHLKAACQDQETALSELGVQLSESRLKMEDLREAQLVLKDATWTADREASSCANCEKPFNVARRKHHCRNCGGIFCNACSDNTMPLPSSAKPVRVCDICQTMLLDRCSSSQGNDFVVVEKP